MAVHPASSRPFQARLRVCRDTLFTKPWAKSFAPGACDSPNGKSVSWKDRSVCAPGNKMESLCDQKPPQRELCRRKKQAVCLVIYQAGV